jgi:hypothetical protein
VQSPAEEYGGLTEEDLRAFMATHPAFDDAGVTITARFGRAVARLLLKRLVASETFNFSIFLLSESLADDVIERDTAPAPLLSNGNDRIGDAVWLVQAEIRNAYAVKDDLPEDAGSAFQRIRDTNFGTRPAIVVDARSSDWVARLYPSGIDFPDLWIEIDLAARPIPKEHLQNTITRFWEQGLRTPELSRLSAQPVWENAAAGMPKPRPEQRIQSRLRDTLFGAYPRRSIRAEVRTEEGRADIFIVGDTTAHSGAPAQMTDWVLELKALCDRTSTGGQVGDREARDAMKKGVVQARAYRSTQNGVQAALCCFEMRGTEEDDAQCFDHVKDEATTHGIDLWRWVLYRSADDARMARYRSGRP